MKVKKIQEKNLECNNLFMRYFWLPFSLPKIWEFLIFFWEKKLKGMQTAIIDSQT